MTSAHQPYALGLAGYPLEHSLSPRLHAAALRLCGLQGEYRLYPIPALPAGQAALEELIAGLRDGRLGGLNVTIPHKQAVIQFLDELTPLARRIGAVNTIYRRGSRLVGDNCDAPGFMTDLGRHFPEAGVPHPALVLGAGGSARAVVHALLAAGWHVTIAARRIQQAQDIMVGSSFGEEQWKVIGLEMLADYIREMGGLPAVALAPGKPYGIARPGLPALIVNTTPLGMLPDVENSPWPPGTPFPAAAFVYDLVYNPADTRLVRCARSAGLRAASGLGMLVEQAALAFERWTGMRPSSDSLRQEISAII